MLEDQAMEMTIPVTMIATMMMMTMEIEADEEEIMTRMMDPGEVSRGKESNMHPGGQDQYWEHQKCQD